MRFPAENPVLLYERYARNLGAWLMAASAWVYESFVFVLHKIMREERDAE